CNLAEDFGPVGQCPSRESTKAARCAGDHRTWLLTLAPSRPETAYDLSSPIERDCSFADLLLCLFEITLKQSSSTPGACSANGFRGHAGESATRFLDVNYFDLDKRYCFPPSLGARNRLRISSCCRCKYTLIVATHGLVKGQPK